MTRRDVAAMRLAYEALRRCGYPGGKPRRLAMQMVRQSDALAALRCGDGPAWAIHNAYVNADEVKRVRLARLALLLRVLLRVEACERGAPLVGGANMECCWRVERGEPESVDGVAWLSRAWALHFAEKYGGTPHLVCPLWQQAARRGGE
jgi:hypothetical protein